MLGYNFLRITIHFFFINMSDFTPTICIERVKTIRNKDKAVVEGFIYTLNRTKEMSYTGCAKKETNATLEPIQETISL